MQKMIKKLLGHGKLRSQPLMEKMYLFSLHGMNFGMAMCASSGEVNVLKYVKSRLAGTPSPWMIFDVGANVGEYALAVQQIFGSDCVIHSFEPALTTLTTFETLSKKVAHLSRIQCHHFGLSDKVSSVNLHYEQPNSAIASIYPQRPDHAWQTDIVETIKLSTIDGFCGENKIERVDFLKIDVEGHEFNSLSGAKRMIDSDAIRMIQFEFGPRHVDSRTYFRDFYYLLNPKYKLSRVVADGLVAIKEYSEYLELFGAPINYFAEHR